MKNKFTLLAMIALAVVIIAVGPIFAQITGSAHDFTSDGWAGGEICAPCHIPHNASNEAALWARGSLADLGPYTLWEDAELGSRSLTCLSCHDGTLALEGAGGTTFMEGDDNLGEDLTDDHPIGVMYTTSTSQSRWFNPPLNGLRLADGKVECSTCHQVHGTDYDALLRTSNYASGLCLSCHNR